VPISFIVTLYNEAAVVDCHMSIMNFRQVSFYTRDMFLKNAAQIKHRIPVLTAYFLELEN